jgi:F-type H+-transporting ATPase subunit gamma
MASGREIDERLGSLHQLLEIVSAIRAMAATQMQQSEGSLDAIRRYTSVVGNALADAASLLPSDHYRADEPRLPHPALVVFCAEHGLCGAFNEPMISMAAEAIEGDSNLQVVFVGVRGAQRAAERDIRPQLTISMASHSGGVTATARRIASWTSEMLARRSVTSIDLVFTRYGAVQRGSAQHISLLPLDTSVIKAAETPIPPLANISPRQLFDELAAEYVFALLEEAAMESFASENAARFRMMDAARDNIQRKTTDLGGLARRMRQDAVTAEILEIIGGTEAQMGG